MERLSISALWGILGKVTAVITITAIIGAKAHMIETKSTQQVLVDQGPSQTIILSE